LLGVPRFVTTVRRVEARYAPLMFAAALLAGVLARRRMGGLAVARSMSDRLKRRPEVR
jgi:hypothetical protein